MLRRQDSAIQSLLRRAPRSLTRVHRGRSNASRRGTRRNQKASNTRTGIPASNTRPLALNHQIDWLHYNDW